MDEPHITETITLHDIYDLLKATHDQACKTNGRVSKLEKRSIGNWIAEHPYKFGLFLIILSSALNSIPDNAVIDAVKTLIK